MKTLIKQVQNHIVYYPTPINLSYLWSFGSLIGVFLGLQIVTGILLAMNYTPHIAYAFASVEHIMRDVPYGWLLRYMHANGASMIFIFIYAHMARGLYYQSYQYPRQEVWYTGVTLFVLMAGTAFLGYVLPWGQMSYWGATVITNIITSIPLIGEPLVIWIWGGFSVNNATLNRFFSLHFVLPFVIAGLAILHIILLHRVGSSNPMGVEATDVDYVPFFPYFFYKDLFAFLVSFTFLWCICIWAPNLFGHPDNYIPASAMTTPSHIVPEWYFLPYYAILKSIPSKLGGAIAMAASMGLLYALPHLDRSETSGPRFKTFHHVFFTLFILDVILLGWVGGKAPTPTLVAINQVLTFGYFFHILFVMPALGVVAHRERSSQLVIMKLSTSAMVAITIVALLVGIAFFTVAERKVLASLQRRRGPNVVGIWGSLQAIADGLKLAVKEVVMPNRANKSLFVLAPILTFGLRVTSWAVIPVDFYSRVNFLVSDVSLLYLLAISSLGVYGIILSGWSSNSKYAFIGSLRSSAQMISYEIFLALIFLTILLLVNSLNLAEVVRAQTASWLMAPLLPLAVVFFISILAETNRAPFDLPEAEAEIVAGYNIEYSSMTFALFFLGEYGNMLVLSYMMALLFMGGWTTSLTFLPGSFIIAGKACVVAFMIIFVRGNFPRYRYDQLMGIGWEAFLPFTFALLIFFIGAGL